jgi:hypothetical protein
MKKFQIKSGRKGGAMDTKCKGGTHKQNALPSSFSSTMTSSSPGFASFIAYSNTKKSAWESKNLWDILSIHNNILHLCKANSQNSPNSPNAMNNNIQNVQHIENIEEKHHFSFYLLQALPLMDKYKAVIKERGKIKFMGNNQQTPSDDVRVIVLEYMSLVRRYFPQWYEDLLSRDCHSGVQDVSRTSTSSSSSFGGAGKSSKLEGLAFNPTSLAPTTVTSSMLQKWNKCSHCQEENAPFLIHDGLITCESCGVTSEFSKGSVICYKDIDRVNITSKYQYDRITHFKDCINQFQGKQNSTIDKKVYEDLLFQFRQHDLIPDNWEDLPKDEAFALISKEHILLFLKETNHTKHYEDIVLIHHNLTGIIPPDLSHIENKLLQDFDALTNLYDRKYRNLERKNFINTQYVLFQLLRRHKFPCKKEDFNILKTVDRKYYHDDITRSLFEELGYNFTATF